MPTGRVRFTKVLSTPPAYDRAVVDAVRELAGERGDAVEGVAHGTTVATNAVLERRGARTALVTTEGFRDVLELRRMRMPHLYDYFWTKPPSLVPRRLRFEIGERMTAAGEALRALDEDEARALAGRLREADPEAVAVCLLHAHLHPAHEQRLGAILREELPGVPISLSSEILREQQEYERTATTVVNAYVRPLMGRYLGEIRRGLDDAGIAAPLTIMQSAGGLMTAADATARPVYALESGPAAGVVAGLALARSLGHENAIAFDMGGTTAKASLIEEGRVSRSVEYEVGASLSAGSRLLRGSGELIRIPTIDIAEVGAGGGSIAWLDAADGLHVGPAQRGRGAGPGLLRPRRRRADRHRRERRARLHPDRPARLGRPDRLPRARRGVAGGARRAARALGGRGGTRDPRPGQRHDDARPARGLDGEGPRSGRLRRSSPTAAPAPCTRPRSPPSSASGRRSCRRSQASSRPPGCCSPARSSTTSASAGSAPASRTWRRCSGSTTRCGRLSPASLGHGGRGRMAAPGRRPLPRPELERHDRLPGRDRRRCPGRARRALRGRARAAVRHAPRSRLAGRRQGAPPDRARPAGNGADTAERARAGARGRRAGARASVRATARSRRPCAHARRSEPSPSTARC